MVHKSLDAVIENYRNLLREHDHGPLVAQWSPEGQLVRIEKLMEAGDLRGKRVLDIGCGLGDLLPLLKNKFGQVNYTGIDIVPELIEIAACRQPDGHFFCRDILEDPPTEKFDFGLISGVFNNSLIPDTTTFLEQMVAQAFSLVENALAFNFTSKMVSFRDPNMAYHDPLHVVDFCLNNLSSKVTMHHHYYNKDVAVFVYR